jgi:hypothetical protein
MRSVSVEQFRSQSRSEDIPHREPGAVSPVAQYR